MYHVFKKLGKTKRWRAQTLPETPKLMSRSLKAKYVNDGTDENWEIKLTRFGYLGSPGSGQAALLTGEGVTAALKQFQRLVSI